MSYSRWKSKVVRNQKSCQNFGRFCPPKFKLYGNPVLLWKPSCASIIHVFYPYTYMALRHGRWPWDYQRRLTRCTSGALGEFWMSTDQNLSPMTRYALVLAVLVGRCPQPPSFLLWTPAPHRPLTRPLPCFTSLHYGSSWWLAVPDNPGYEQWRLTCDQWTSDWQRRSGVLRSDRHGGNS